MSLKESKQQLHQFIDKADVDQINQLLSVINEPAEEKLEWDKNLEKEMDRRRKLHLSGEATSLTVKQVKENVLKSINSKWRKG